MKFFLILAILVSSLTGCDYLPTSENKVKKLVAKALLDPDSAQFRSLSTGVNDGDFCGSVDGKNKMGGYSGASPFIANLKTGSVEIGDAPIKKSDFELLALMLRAKSLRPNSDFFDIANEEARLKPKCTFPERWKNSCKEEYYLPSLEIRMGERLCYALIHKANQDPGGYDFAFYKFMSEIFP